MSNDKTLATAKHGGCVQLGDAHVAVLREMRARLTDAGSPARTAALDAAIDPSAALTHSHGNRCASRVFPPTARTCRHEQ